VIIVDLVPKAVGWSPINYMVSLAEELFEAEVLRLEQDKPSLVRKIEALLCARQKKTDGESCLLICASPTDLLSLLVIKGWRNRFRFIAAWIIDSFWIDWIPGLLELSRPFDHLFVTSAEDIPEWIEAMKTPTTWLPWGSDVLRLGGKDSKRIWDLARVGRQPPEWDDDLVTEKNCRTLNLSFHGRLQEPPSVSSNQQMLMNHYRQTKFLLAFSNTAAPAPYTHPSREYVTARWVDALACGAVVAGIPPKGPSSDRLLWSGATLDLGTIRRENGLHAISEAVERWEIGQAERNYRQSLEHLDWRWRFAEIADVFKESPRKLDDELQLLRQTIRQEKEYIT
jgi:hypothetical protein